MWYIIILFMLALIIKYYSNIRSAIQDLFRLIASSIKCLQKASMKSDIEFIANNSISNINAITPELQLPDLKIEWVKNDNGNIVYDTSKVIVMMKFDRDPTRNIINATSAYIKNSVLPNSRIYMDPSIVKAIDFTLIRKFLQNSSHSHYSVPIFVKEHLEDFSLHQEVFDKINTTDKDGLFTRILLREYSIWGSNLIGEIPSPNHCSESVGILDFVHSIAIREHEELTPLQFVSDNIKIGILLVAKSETFYNAGIKPYVRRIQEGFAKGIETFYLLARNDKILILEAVFNELMQSHDYILLNQPKIYRDFGNRENVCYCIRIDSNGNLAQTYSQIEDSIDKRSIIEIVVSHVYKDVLKGLYHNVGIYIPKNEVTDKPIKLSNFYTPGMTIKAIPISIEEDGTVTASLKDTDSNPENLLNNNFAVGESVIGIVEEVLDDIVYLSVKDSDQKAMSLRRDLTYSKHSFLHRLFPVGSSLECEIIDIDYIDNRLHLKLKDLVDPWDNLSIANGDKLNVTIFNIEPGRFISEVFDGVKVIIPFSELSWFDDEIEVLKSRYKRNSSMECWVSRIDSEKRYIICSTKDFINPYEEFYKNLQENKISIVTIQSINSFGMVGKINQRYNVWIPVSETHVFDQHFQCKLGENYKVHIKSIQESKRGFIGSFIPFIKHPLSIFSQFYSEGDIINQVVVRKVSSAFANVEIRNDKIKDINVNVYIGEISNICRIDNFQTLSNLITECPKMVELIDYEHNCVELSLKMVLEANNETRFKLDYDTKYEAIIIGRKHQKYIVILKDLWIEGFLESSKKYNNGDELIVWMTAYGTQYAYFIE